MSDTHARLVFTPETYLPADFVAAAAAISDRRAVYLESGVRALCGLANGGFLNKTGCKDARQAVTNTMNDMARAMWDRHMDLVRAHHTGPLNDLYYSSIDSGPMLTSWLKRATAVSLGFSGTNYTPLVAELANMIRWFTPISQQLLSKEVLARAGSGIDPAVKQAQVEKRRAQVAARGTIYMTCPCCYREIAVINGRMVHHGYERPSIGYQTASCFGFAHEPLEVSKSGVVHVKQQLEHQLEATSASLLRAPKLRTLTVPNPKHRSWDKACKEPALIQIDRTHADWTHFHQSLMARLNVECIGLQHDIQERKAVIAAWHKGMNQADVLTIHTNLRHAA